MYNKVIESEKQCKLCKKSLGERTAAKQLSLCSDCYLISFERIESTLVKRQILILYLPWWHNTHNCNMCSSELTFTSDCQKYCTNCLIFYTGCRYCLTTNIIFGLTGQTHCKKCKRISLIIDNFVDRDVDDFLFNDNIYEDLSLDFAKIIDEYFEPSTLLYYIFRKKGRVKPVRRIPYSQFTIKEKGRAKPVRRVPYSQFTIKEKDRVKPVRWIPYSQFKDVIEMTKGGYGIIYKATWLSYNETVILKRFENSKNNNKYFLNEIKSNQYCFNRTFYDSIIKIYGFTKDPELDDHVLVMEYAPEGDLHKYLQKNFTNLTWLDNIHNNEFIHRDFHSGNILLDVFQWKIGDLGLSQSVNNESSNNEIYGVIPYIAPEIFKGSVFSKETDIYSLVVGILIQKKRPSIREIYLTVDKWCFYDKIEAELKQAEAKRKKLIKSKKIGPEFAGKYHPGAIYTSRPLSDLISKCSSINSISTIEIGNKQDYNYISKEEELDIIIDIKSLSSKNLTIQNSTSLKKRNIEELNLEISDDSGKRIKASTG
ncbi:kinase-like domain-containing protein [Rhizophagus diaphanus]|nr:kinase-like domain-containing protein [Rhizophagus diaphanus] [Rhizophagus sp. MUCL 43196]